MWQAIDPAIRRAILDTVLVMGPAEPNPTATGARAAGMTNIVGVDGEIGSPVTPADPA